MIVRDRYKSLELKVGAIWKHQLYFVVGIPSNNGTIKCKDYKGRLCVRHLLGVDVVKE